MTTQTKIMCPACNREAKQLVTHHWYEAPDMTLHQIEICQSCNRILVTHKFYGRKFHADHKTNLTHILPPWEKQLGVIRQALPLILARELQAARKAELKAFRDTQPKDSLYRNFWIIPDYLAEDVTDMTITWTFRVDCHSLEEAHHKIDVLLRETNAQ